MSVFIDNSSRKFHTIDLPRLTNAQREARGRRFTFADAVGSIITDAGNSIEFISRGVSGKYLSSRPPTDARLEAQVTALLSIASSLDTRINQCAPGEEQFKQDLLRLLARTYHDIYRLTGIPAGPAKENGQHAFATPTCSLLSLLYARRRALEWLTDHAEVSVTLWPPQQATARFTALHSDLLTTYHALADNYQYDKQNRAQAKTYYHLAGVNADGRPHASP